jgi:PTH1 family peptidyl-tRNA hydrolase
MKLLVGLGNPGAEYAHHRHNIGFMAVDRIADRFRLPPWRKKFSGLVTEGDIGADRAILLKPQTYMNDSGRSVQEAAHFHKIALADIIVLHDELDIAPARLKVKTGGGNAGHNGLRSITAHLGNDYVRVRLGIGHPGAKELVHNWVLGNFAKADQAWLDEMLDAIAQAAPRLASGKLERLQTDVAQALMPEKDAPAERPEREPKVQALAKPAARHPAGERGNKQQNAIAENLRKWMEAKKAREGE